MASGAIRISRVRWGHLGQLGPPPLFHELVGIVINGVFTMEDIVHTFIKFLLWYVLQQK